MRGGKRCPVWSRKQRCGNGFPVVSAAEGLGFTLVDASGTWALDVNK